MSMSPSQKTTIPDTRVSNYERVSAWLTSVVVVLGVLVGLALMIWLMFVFRARRTEAVAIQNNPGRPGKEAPKGEAEDFLEPGVQEFPEVEVPQLTDALEAVTDAVSTVKARLEKIDGSAQLMGKGKGLGHREGGGEGGTGGRPWDRWQVEYSSTDLQTYARQLSYFGIEVGVVSRTTQRIDVISNLTSPSPIASPTTRREEKRMFFTHVNPRLRQWDQALARKAGIDNFNGRFLVQFYPRQITNLLAKLEAEYAQENGLNLKNVSRTLFKVRESGNGFEYYVDSMN